MYKNILIPVALDQEHDTQASFEAARQLADADAVFTVVHVQEPIPAYVGSQFQAKCLQIRGVRYWRTCIKLPQKFQARRFGSSLGMRAGQLSTSQIRATLIASS